ncbi:MAG: calcium/sodium antiporter [Bacteroidales bacterium]|nr:calcium/sodium antiporter [Bacteroidales bacterium]
MEYLLLAAGLTLLLIGGKILVQGGVALARRFSIPPLVIGLTIVSFGTSAPELFVSVVAGIRGQDAVAIGNVIGSNIANIALVLAITAIIFPIPVRSSSVKVDGPFMIAVSLLLVFFMLDMKISRVEGIIFLCLILGYTFWHFRFSKKQDQVPDEINAKPMALWLIILSLAGAIIGLAFGSDLLVKNASEIAREWNVDERVIAITMVAFGTSLPELVTSVIAAFQKEMDISIGNIIGSNIFNILVVLGVAGLINPLSVDKGFLTSDIYWMLGTAVLLFVYILPFKGGKLSRLKGLSLFVIYCVYVYVLYQA